MDQTLPDIRDIRIDDFDYPLPDNRIAGHPLADRDKCLLLVARRGDQPATMHFCDLPRLLPADAMLVYNNTRVINARLRFRKNLTGAPVEIFILEPEQPADYAENFASRGPVRWACFVGNSKRWKDDTTLQLPLPTTTLTARRTERRGNASIVEFSWDNPLITFAEIISLAGEIPIPPYLNRPTETTDTTDYQTVFGHIDGSVAAPTAGLHFTPALLDAIDARGIQRREVTLHVGAGTFQPVKSDTIGDHPMHSEFIRVSRSLIEELARRERPVIAVGTTSVRTLESLYHIGRMASQGRFRGQLPQWEAYSSDAPDLSVGQAMQALLDHLGSAQHLIADTRLMIAPGYRYRIVDGIITNFHQPRSTLLLLVSAFLDRHDSWRRLYDYALARPYRFLSYGDAMLLL